MKTHAALAISCLFASLSAHAVGIYGQGTWETTLQDRDLDGNLTTAEAYYDTVLGITWLADANYAGTMDWYVSNDLATNLNPYSSGIYGWHLPAVADTGEYGCNYSITGGTDCGYNVDTDASEMAHLFYVTLGNRAYYDTSGNFPQPGWGLTNTGPFSITNLDLDWIASPYGPDWVWLFNFYTGNQSYGSKTGVLNAWAVHDGDVGTPIGASAVPLPASIWLLGSGLLVVLGTQRKRILQ